MRVADLSLILEEDENNLNITGAFPMADEVGMIQDAFTFRLINQGTTKANYQIKLVDITTGSKLSRNDVRYSLIKEGVNKIDYLTSLYKGIIDSGTISGGDTYNYELRLWIAEEVEDNDRVANKSLSYRIDVEVGQLEETKYIGMIQTTTDTSTEAFWGYRSSITSIVFENTISIPSEGVVESWDVSVNKDGSVMAYIEDDGLGTDTYKLHIQGDGVVYANVNSNNLFQDFGKTTSIEGLEYFDTSNVTNMGAMFRGCSSLLSLDLSNFDTSNVTSMGQMFWNCGSLTSLDISNFDTSNVTSMSLMFTNCWSLTSLDVSSFDTSKVTTMQYMFQNCGNLTTLDVSNFNTSNVNNMNVMFSGCSNLTSLDLSNFDTSNVTRMDGMFGVCKKIKELNLSSFDTSKVTNMNNMFENCYSLITVNLSSFNTPKLTSMGSMFNGCSSLTSLDLSSFNTSNVTNMGLLFMGCSNLTKLNLSSGFDTSNVTNMGFMFDGCKKLTASIEIIGTKCTGYGYMFRNTSTAEGASFIIYGDGTNEELINNMIATGSGNVTYVGVKQ